MLMKGGLGRFMSWLQSRNALIFSILPRMCPESRLPRGSKFCTCPRHLSLLRPVPVTGLCGPGVTCFPVRMLPAASRTERARRAAVGRVAPSGRTCTQAPGGNWPDGNTGGIDNYPVCLRHSGQQSHTYYCLLLSVSWFCRCPCHRATCVMTVSVSTLLTG